MVCLPLHFLYFISSSTNRFPSVLGELLPAQGCHYWEIVVSACRSYRIGICYEAVTQSNVLGLSDTSWCMRCCPTQTR